MNTVTLDLETYEKLKIFEEIVTENKNVIFKTDNNGFFNKIVSLDNHEVLQLLNNEINELKNFNTYIEVKNLQLQADLKQKTIEVKRLKSQKWWKIW